MHITFPPPHLRRTLFSLASAAVIAAPMLPSTTEAAAVPATMSLKLAWNAVPETNIKGYRVYVGTASNQYSRLYETGNVTSFPVDELVSGQVYYFAVKAINTNGLEGERSDELGLLVVPQPRTGDDFYSVAGETPLVVPAGGVLDNDVDLDSTTLTAILDSPPSHGSLVLNPDGGFTYTPHPGFSGSDSFTYHTSDGTYESNQASVELDISKPVYQLLENGSFESNHTGWTVTGNQTIESSSPYVPKDGTKLVAFNSRNMAANAVLSQSFPTVLGETYQISFDANVLAYNTNAQRLTISVNGALNLLSQTITNYGTGTGSNRWQSYSYSFVADSTTTTLSFKDESATTHSIDLLLDNVKVLGAKKSNDLPLVAETSTTPSLSGRPGAMSVGMMAANVGTYVLERSEDLVTWEVLETREVTAPGAIAMMDTRPALATQTKMFYRIGYR